MIGIVTSACAMTTMAAPSFDHKNSHTAPTHQMNNKHQPSKHGMNQGPQHKASYQHFDNKNHKTHFQKNMKHAPDSKHKQPPRHR